MLERLRLAIFSEPWRTVAVVLGLAFLLMLFAFLSEGDDGAGVVVEGATTTTSAEDLTTTSVGADDSASTTTAEQPQATADGAALIAIRIDNATLARPQIGLGAAPVLVEYPVEGGLTRFTAIYPRGLTGLAGPIRSLRPVDPDLLGPLAPVVVSTGGQDFVLQEMEGAGLETITAGFSSLFTSLERPQPHDTFVDLELLDDIIDESLSPASGLPAGDLPEGGASATEVTLPYDGVSFVYEAGSGYTRLQDGEPFQVYGVDGESLENLSHDVVVVLFAAERSAGYTDVEGSPVSDFDVIGSGDLLVFHDGELVSGVWSRSAQEDGYVFTDSAGELFGLPEGRVYLAVVPRGSEVVVG